MNGKIYEACKCRECTSACERCPGWFSPEEAIKAMDAGLAGNMMLDWMSKDHKCKNFTYILSPAVVASGGQLAPEGDDFLQMLLGNWQKGECGFLVKGLCSIHDRGFKPLQCRAATHDDNDYIDNWAMAVLWDTAAGKAAVARWRKETGCTERIYGDPEQ